MKQVKEEKATTDNVPSGPPLVVMFYGQSKIGLSSLALQFPDVLVLNVSDELRHLQANFAGIPRSVRTEAKKGEGLQFRNLFLGGSGCRG